MLDIHTELGKVLAAGEKVALATVVETRGPTPRLPGTRMAIRRNGQHLGTVGGGCGEAEVIRAGLLALDEGRPRWVRADLTEEVTLESETSCGGTMDFLVVPWGRELLPVVEAVAGAVVSRQRVNLVTVLQPIPGAMLVWGDNDSAWAGLSGEQADALSQPMALPAEVSDQARKVTVDIQGQPWSLLWEVVRPAPCLLIAGGGHIAVPLSQMGRLLGFEVVVLDDRPSFADPARFPGATRVLCGPFRDVLGDMPIDAQTYAVVVTRGHRHDLECVQRLLGRGAAYLGMIGSRRRVAGVLRLLRDQGVSETELRQLHSPIGLDLGGQTPAEIALSILAEIVLLQRGGTGRSLSLAGQAEE